MTIEFPHGNLEVKTGMGIMDQLKLEVPLSIQNSSVENFKILSENSIYLNQTEGWGISAKVPTSQYSEPSLMLVATPLNETNFSKNQTHLIYDAPTEAQNKYWQTALSLINKASLLSQDPNNPLYNSFVFLTGHHCRFKQIENHPSARSIQSHHDHLMMIPPKLSEQTYQAKDFALPQETSYLTDKNNKLLPYYLPNFVSFVKENFEPNINIRKNLPIGYNFKVDNDFQSLASVLNQHFNSYKHAMEASEYLEKSILGKNVSEELSKNIIFDLKKGRVIQPAFTLYIVPSGEQKLEIIVSPMLIGIGGPERAGIQLKKGPDYPSKLDNNQIQQVISDLKISLPQNS